MERRKWKKIPESPSYSISNYGEIKNKDNKRLNPWLSKSGYRQVTFKIDKKFTRAIHLLVATLFLGKPDNAKCVVHIDGNHENNYVGNLKWLFKKEKIQREKFVKETKEEVTSLKKVKINLIEEEWRAVDGFSKYEVSNYGSIRNKGNKKEFDLKCKFYRDCNKRLYVSLYKDDKKRKREAIHRLVAKAFILNPKNYDQVNHKDGDIYNNYVYNLEWCTGSENVCKTYDVHDRKKTCKRVQQISKNGDIIKEFDSVKDAKKETGEGNIYRCLHKNIYSKKCKCYWKFINEHNNTEIEDEDGEIWKNIPNSKHFISNKGRLKNDRGTLMMWLDHEGYFSVNISINKKKKRIYILFLEVLNGCII